MLWALSLLLILGLLGACTGNRSEWRELAISDGGFSVLMRGEPIVARNQVDTPVGRMFTHMYASDRPDSYFAVGYADYPLAVVVGTAPERVFSGIRDTWAKRIDGKVVSRDNMIRLASKYPGTEFFAEGKSKGADAFVQGRLYLVDQRLYQVIALGLKDQVPQAVVNRFLNSFRLIPQSEVGSVGVEPAGK